VQDENSHLHGDTREEQLEVKGMLSPPYRDAANVHPFIFGFYHFNLFRGRVLH
jgi:hypothetical protein